MRYAGFADLMAVAMNSPDHYLPDFPDNHKIRVAVTWMFAAALHFSTTLMTVTERFEYIQKTIIQLQNYTTTMFDRMLNNEEKTIALIASIQNTMNRQTDAGMATVEIVGQLANVSTAHQSELSELKNLAEQIGNPDSPKTKRRKKS